MYDIKIKNESTEIKLGSLLKYIVYSTMIIIHASIPGALI